MTVYSSDTVGRLVTSFNDGIEYGDPYWDDIRVPATAVIANGAHAPIFAQFMDDGVVGAGSALSFDGDNDEYVMIPSNAALNFDSGAAPVSFSLGMALKVQPGWAQGYILYKDGGYWSLGILNSGQIQFKTESGISATTPDTINIGSVEFIVVTVEATTTEVTASIYIDDVLEVTETAAGNLNDAAGDIYVNSREGVNFFTSFGLDELRIWNSALNSSEITGFYLDGAGTEGSIATEICGYHFNEGAGTDCDNFEGTAALDIDMTSSGNDPDWIAGFISAASVGIFTYLFSPTVRQEILFSMQTPHAMVLSSNIEPHVHWSPMDNSAGDVVWSLEYSWQSTDGVFSPTTTITTTSTASGVAKTHQLEDFSSIDGSGISGVSSMLLGRLYRNAANVADTYTGLAALLEVDFHYQIDTPGSKDEYTK